LWDHIDTCIGQRGLAGCERRRFVHTAVGQHFHIIAGFRDQQDGAGLSLELLFEQCDNGLKHGLWFIIVMEPITSAVERKNQL